MIRPRLPISPRRDGGATGPFELLRTHRVLAIVGVALLAAMGVSTHVHAQPSQPNIVFILADDLGVADLGVTGQNARAAQGLAALATPNIDALANSGVRFNNFYVGGPNCSPSRNVLLTGFHQNHTMIEQGNVTQDIRGGNEDRTWAQSLQDAGYETGMFGKWHVGGVAVDGASIRSYAALPTQKGFETAYGPMQGNYRLAYHWVSDGTGGMIKSNNPLEPTWTGSGNKVVYGDNQVADRAVDFIRSQAGGSQPFAAYVPFMEAHDPIDQVPKDHPYVNTPGWTQQQKNYAGLVWYLDKHVGQILSAIDDPNNDGNASDSVAANTVVMFASDNGPPVTNNATGWSMDYFDSNGIYYGGKSMTSEGGIRTPLFVRWSGTIAPGTQNNAVGTFADVMPTFAQLTGQDVPLGIDGRSMLSDILGGPASERPDVLSWAMPREVGPDNPNGWTVRVGDWKLSKRNPSSLHTTVTYRLYNIATDPDESTNLAPSRGDIVTALTAIGIAEGGDREPFGPSPDNPSIQERRSTYFTQYKTWAPQGGSTNFHGAANWAGGTQYSLSTNPEANNWNTGPADNWLATMTNAPGVAQQVTMSTSADLLALELRGLGATMALRVNSGARLTARNGLRISPGGILRPRGGEINTIRDLDIRIGGKFDGEGLINGQQSVIAGIPEFAGRGLFEPKVLNRGILTVASDGDASLDAGRLLIQGDYQQFASGVLQMSVFSTGGVAGLNFDQLAVTGKTALAGVLAIAAANTSALMLGATFEMITSSGGLSGAFTTILGPALNPGLAWTVQYTSTSALLKVVQGNSAPLGYLAQWKHSFGVDSAADRDGDGDTDGNDFLLWQRSPAITASADAVPEPAAALLLALGAIAAPSRVRRARRSAGR